MSFINRYATLLAGDAQITMGNKAAGCRKIASVAIEKLSRAADEMIKRSSTQSRAKILGATTMVELRGIFNGIDDYSLVREQIESGIKPALQRCKISGLKISIIGKDGAESLSGTGKNAIVCLIFTPAG